MAEEENLIEEIQNLKPYLSEKTQRELDEILVYGEEIKAEGERKKKERWSKYSREDFAKLLRYKWKNKEGIEKLLGCDDNVGKNVDGKKFFGLFGNKSVSGGKKYEYVGKLRGLERKRFIEEYLYDDILYSGKLDETKVEGKEYSYEDWKDGKVIMKKGETLWLPGKQIGDEGVKAIAYMKLDEGVNLYLANNGIGDEGAKAIAENMKLEECVKLNLTDNQIGAKGAEAISHIELKEGVSLYLWGNKIGPEGAEAIAENMKLKEGVDLNLSGTQIGVEGAKAIAEKMKLRKGVTLHLDSNEIGNEGAKVIAENMKLEEGIYLNLDSNEIGNEGAKAISHMKLKEGVQLSLWRNQIGDEGVEAIMENMKLKNGVTLDLRDNEVSEEVQQKLESWVQSYKARGIKCEVNI